MLERFVLRPIAAVFACLNWLVGLVVLIVLLGMVAAVPGLNLIALGILLDAEGRVTRSGRMLDGFPLVPLAPRLGGIALGIWLWLLPVYFLGSVASDARILHPGSPADILLHNILTGVKTFVIAHLALALAAGGGLIRFFRPFANLRAFLRGMFKAEYWDDLAHSVVKAVEQVGLRYHLWLGLRGFTGAALWLWPATFLFAANDKPQGPGVLLTVLGGFCLIAVLQWVPFLQGRFAAWGRFDAFTELRTVWHLRRRAPIAHFFAVLVTLALSLPLFLFKIVLPPRDALWLVTPLFIVGMYPGKLLSGWALWRGSQRAEPVWWPVRVVTRLLTIVAVAVFVFIMFLMQFTAEHGKGVLFEHHAFLLWIGT